LKKENLKTFFIYPLSGIAIGSGFSFLYDPKNYLAGFDVMRRTVLTSSLSMQDKLNNISTFLPVKLFFVSILLLLLVLLLAQVFAVKKTSYQLKIQALVLLLSIVNILPGLLSSWSPDPRYMVPGATLSLFSIVLCVSQIAPVKVWYGIVSSVVAVTLVTRAIPINTEQMTNNNEIVQFSPQAELRDCVVLLSSSEVFLAPNKYNWLSKDLGAEGARSFLAQSQSKKRLCN
jgi:hypothetical protein